MRVFCFPDVASKTGTELCSGLLFWAQIQTQTQTSKFRTTAVCELLLYGGRDFLPAFDCAHQPGSGLGRSGGISTQEYIFFSLSTFPFSVLPVKFLPRDGFDRPLRPSTFFQSDSDYSRKNRSHFPLLDFVMRSTRPPGLERTSFLLEVSQGCEGYAYNIMPSWFRKKISILKIALP